MRVKIISVDIFQKISVLFVVMAMGIACASDRTIVEHKRKWSVDSADCISRKESEFDFISLNDLKPWYNALSLEKQAAIQKNLEKQDAHCVALFNFTRLHDEIMGKVVSHMFNDKKEVLDIFCGVPLYNALNCYAWVQDIMEGKKSVQFKTLCSQDPNFKMDMLFTLVKEIKIFDAWYSNYVYYNSDQGMEELQYCEREQAYHEGKYYPMQFYGYRPEICSKSKLKSIAKIIETFKASLSNIDVTIGYSSMDVDSEAGYNHMDVGYMAYLYNLIWSSYNSEKMKSLCNGYVDLRELPKLLERTDMMIED